MGMKASNITLLLSLNRSRSLTPPPRSERSNTTSHPSLPSYLEPQSPNTPPFEPISFNMRTKASAVSHLTTTPPLPPEQDKPDEPGISTPGSEKKRTVRFSTPTHSDSETETTVHAPMPVSGPEATSNPSPSLVTGQSGTNFRASLEVPASPNIFIRSYSTGSTDSTDSETYVTPRQSISDLETEKLFRKSKKTNSVCKNCIALRRSFSNSQDEICKLKTKLQARNKLMLDQVTIMLKKEVLQKELECYKLKETCTNAVLFVQELEMKVAELKRLVYSKEMETQEAWRYYDVALDVMQRCSSPQNPVFDMKEGRGKPHGWLTKNDEDGELGAELSCSTGDESNSENSVGFFRHGSTGHRSGNRWRSLEKGMTIPGDLLARNASQSRSQGSEFSPAAPYVSQHGKKQATTVTRRAGLSMSSKLIAMMKQSTRSMPPPQRVASDSHPRKVHDVRSPRSSLQHESYYHDSTTPGHSSIPITTSHHTSRHSKWQGGNQRVPQAETGYWEEEQTRPTNNDKDGGSFVPEIHKGAARIGSDSQLGVHRN